MTQVRSFTAFLNKFKDDFGQDTLNLARRHKRSWECLIYLYTRNIPISNNDIYGDGATNIMPNNRLSVTIGYKEGPVGILVILSHEVTHCKDYWGKKRGDLYGSAQTYLDFVEMTEINAIKEHCKAYMELKQLTPVNNVINLLFEQMLYHYKHDPDFDGWLLKTPVYGGYSIRGFYKRATIGNRVSGYMESTCQDTIKNDSTYTY